MNLMIIFMCNDSNNHTTFGKGWLASQIFHIRIRIMSITIAAEFKVGQWISCCLKQLCSFVPFSSLVHLVLLLF